MHPDADWFYVMYGEFDEHSQGTDSFESWIKNSKPMLSAHGMPSNQVDSLLHNVHNGAWMRVDEMAHAGGLQTLRFWAGEYYFSVPRQGNSQPMELPQLLNSPVDYPIN